MNDNGPDYNNMDFTVKHKKSIVSSIIIIIIILLCVFCCLGGIKKVSNKRKERAESVKEVEVTKNDVLVDSTEELTTEETVATSTSAEEEVENTDINIDNYIDSDMLTKYISDLTGESISLDDLDISMTGTTINIKVNDFNISMDTDSEAIKNIVEVYEPIINGTDSNGIRGKIENLIEEIMDKYF